MKKLLLAALMVPALSASAQQTQRVPLFEVFTSSTCPPCKPANESYEAVLVGKPVADYVSIKYQEYFPGAGDPYCTAETKSRFGYYGLGGVPHMMIDGGWDQHAGYFTTPIYTQYRNIAPKFDLSGAYTFNASTKTITAKLNYAPLLAAVGAAGAKLHVAVIESVTDNNVKSNGETEFYNVVKKMLPSQAGTTLPALTVGTKQSTTLTFQFKGNYRLPANGKDTSFIDFTKEHSVEDFANLKVVAWVQAANKEVYQAANLLKVNSLGVDDVSNSVGSYNVYPNPATNVVNIDVNMKSPDNVSAVIVNLTGAVVAQKSVDMKTGKNQISIDTQSLPTGQYTVIISDSKTNAFVDKLVIIR